MLFLEDVENYPSSTFKTLKQLRSETAYKTIWKWPTKGNHKRILSLLIFAQNKELISKVSKEKKVVIRRILARVGYRDIWNNQTAKYNKNYSSNN